VTRSRRRLAIDLASDNPRCVAHCLLEANRSYTPIVRSYVDIEPREIDARPVVHGDRAKERGKVLHAVRGHREKDDVANDPEHVCQQHKLWPTGSPERHKVDSSGTNTDQDLDVCAIAEALEDSRVIKCQRRCNRIVQSICGLK
jgi:hypothetical protein